ncbi:TlyA family RNA methyltransferase [Rivibacter subsaxonicus]|uniref:23S rRNA (Cytidine1920-2'-O)/16S rRNA (Cytidine1409-2'-O)-methyltransferase n=1 Tax=Rivibacter subsaxonicus TaxID=457575 RepID=A0A4Q7W061_9BURK|nr:TlyA family RNA methyltransferase [Rivibacter subsaxonicus]RZU02185.1 23S rRNA (cytidine1920-2'-O)/16S rRNA (cytidine1409-2'-O)-methyltransferase [Rivibacter subsaxonicus]
MRADQLLVERGLASTRSQAQRLIKAGVRWLGPQGWQVVAKNGEELPAEAQIELQASDEAKWVSRAGLKLEGALAHTGIDVTGTLCLDVGQSTGGFTEVLLAAGAKKVVGVDVGHGQLHPKLREHPQVRAFEGLNARGLTRSALKGALPSRFKGFDLIVGDLSFIPLPLVLPALAKLLAPTGTLLMLVKPQFELQPKDIGKGGLVKDAASYVEVEAKLRSAVASLGLQVVDWFDSAIAGGDGNREFFIRAQPGAGSND